MSEDHPALGARVPLGGAGEHEFLIFHATVEVQLVASYAGGGDRAAGAARARCGGGGDHVARRRDRKYVTATSRAPSRSTRASDVRVLGVPVGAVETVTPAGDVVKVKM